MMNDEITLGPGTLILISDLWLALCRLSVAAR